MKIYTHEVELHLNKKRNTSHRHHHHYHHHHHRRHIQLKLTTQSLDFSVCLTGAGFSKLP